MKKITHSLDSWSGVDDWRVHFMQNDEDRLGLLKAIDTVRSTQPWDGNTVIPMRLVGKRGLKDNYPEFAHRREGDWVRIVEPSENDWKATLDWTASGGLGNPIAGPPRNRTYDYRIVSETLRDAMKKFHLPDHRFYPLEIIHDVTGERRTYYLFHLLKSSWEFKEMAYWPAIAYSIVHKKTREVIQAFPAGSASTYEEALAPYRKFIREQGQDKMEVLERPYAFHHDYLVFQEPYDLVRGFLAHGLSTDMGTALEAEFGNRVASGAWLGMTQFTGFKPGVDEIPKEIPYFKGD